MAISETQLDTWSRQGSVTQSSQTYATIKGALEDSTTSYSDKDYSIFLQGSYGNDTNVYADSDVDVVMRLNSTFYQDITELNETEKAAYENAYSNASYGIDDFKKDVIAQLTKRYGSAVKPGKKAIFVEGSGSRRDSDILVCTKFRRYLSFSSQYSQNYIEGISFFTVDGRIINYPKQHSENVTTKHQGTLKRFKPTVRIFENIRNHMTSKGLLKYGSAPSYFIEGMLCNVPNHKFEGGLGDTVVNCLNWLINDADREKLVCANEQYYLLNEYSKVTWNANEFDSFLKASCDLWNNW